MARSDNQEPGGGVEAGDGSAGELTQHAVGDSRRGTAIPPTVLVTELDTGELVIQGRPDGPRVRLSPADALPLRWELAAAFECAEQAAADDLDEAE